LASADPFDPLVYVPEDGEAKVEQKCSLKLFERVNFILLMSFHKIIRPAVSKHELLKDQEEFKGRVKVVITEILEVFL
jgi:hypothetical protein